MKRSILLIITMAMVTALFAGCGSSDPSPGNPGGAPGNPGGGPSNPGGGPTNPGGGPTNPGGGPTNPGGGPSNPGGGPSNPGGGPTNPGGGPTNPGGGPTNPGGGPTNPGAGSCAAIPSFYGEIGNASAVRGGGVAEAGAVPSTEDANLAAVIAEFQDRSTFTSFKYGIEKTLSTPIQVTGAVVTATELPDSNMHSNAGHFYIQDKSGGLFVRLNDSDMGGKLPKVGDKVSFKVTKISIFGGDRNNGISQIAGIEASSLQVDDSGHTTQKVYYKDANATGISADDAGSLVFVNGNVTDYQVCPFGNGKIGCYTLTTGDGQTVSLTRSEESTGQGELKGKCLTVVAPVSAYKSSAPTLRIDNNAWYSDGSAAPTNPVNPVNPVPPPPVGGSCAAIPSFYGEIGNASAARGGGVAEAGAVPATEDAKLAAVIAEFQDRSTFTSGKYGLDKTLSAPIEVTGAVVTATELPDTTNGHSNAGHFYIQDKSGGLFVRLKDSDMGGAVPKVGDKVSFKVTQISIFGGDKNNGVSQIAGIEASSLQVDDSARTTQKVYYKDANATGISATDAGSLVFVNGNVTGYQVCPFGKGKIGCYTLTTGAGQSVEFTRSEDTAEQGKLQNKCLTIVAPVSAYKSSAPTLALDNDAWYSDGSGAPVVPHPPVPPPPVGGACSAVASFYGQAGNSSAVRGGGVAEAGPVPMTEDAGLSALLTDIQNPSSFTAGSYNLEKDLSSSPVQITNAIVTATESSNGHYQNSGHFYIQDKSGSIYVRLKDSDMGGAVPKVGDKVSFKVTGLKIWSGAKGDGQPQVSAIEASSMHVDSTDNATQKVYYKEVNKTGIDAADVNTFVYANGTLSGYAKCSDDKSSGCYTLTTPDNKTINVRRKEKSADSGALDGKCVTIAAPVKAKEGDIRVEFENTDWFSDSSSTMVPPVPVVPVPPPAPACSLDASFYGEIGNSSAARGGGVAEAGQVPMSQDANLSALFAEFNNRSSFTSGKYGLEKDLSSNPIQIKDAVVTATEAPYGKYKNSGRFYIQDKSGSLYLYLRDKDIGSVVPQVGDHVSFTVTKLSIYKGKSGSTNGLNQISGIDKSSFSVDSSARSSQKVYYKEADSTGVDVKDVSSVVRVSGTLGSYSVCADSSSKGCYTLTTPDNKTINVRRYEKKGSADVGALDNKCVTITAPVSVYDTDVRISLDNSDWLKAK